MSIIDEAYCIAARDLRKDYFPKGIVTGDTRTIYWSWDSFFASFGACRLRDFEVVKRNLMLYLRHQRKDGMLPRRMSNLSFYLKHLHLGGRGTRFHPSYHSTYWLGSPVFQNLIFVMAAAEYLRQSGDRRFVEGIYPSIRKAMEWAAKQDSDRDGLIEEYPGVQWSESVLKQGKVLVTNVSYKRALDEMASIARLLGQDSDARRFSLLAHEVRKRIDAVFWNGKYYSDWIDYWKHDYFSSDGNVLAVVWGVADKDRGKMIQRYIRDHQLDRVPLKTNHPSYPWYRVFVLNSIAGLYRYHNGFSWIWLGCFDAVAKHRLGMHAEARAEIERIAELICRHETVSEIFDEKGRPAKTWFYRTEKRFAWSAGVFIWAVHELGLVRS
jgi:glycogen debranching enzyme